MFFLFDPLFLVLVVPGLLLSLWASHRVQSAFRRHRKVPTRAGLSGAEVARRLIDAAGGEPVTIEATSGQLSDHYDPTKRVLRLSKSVYGSSSVAAVGVAAHEAGHALQDAQDYTPMRFRSAIVGPASFGSNLGVVLVLIGLLLSATSLVWLGVGLFSLFVLFTLATLPVEFDASRRALSALRQQGILGPQELDGARDVLRAAGLTYLASAATAILQLAYFGLLAGGADE